MIATIVGQFIPRLDRPEGEWDWIGSLIWVGALLILALGYLVWTGTHVHRR